MTIKSNTPAHDKDCWQTPLWLFDALDIEFGFWLDSAASDKNALCAHWLTEADDALNSEWISHGAIWNSACHDEIDRRTHNLDNKDARLYHLEGVIRTQAILLKEGKIKS
ncbi:phage N-6-adenine-methyltransferase [Escherichia coli]